MTALGCVASVLFATVPLKPDTSVHLLDEELRPPDVAIVAEAPRANVAGLPASSPFGSGWLAASPDQRDDEAPGSSSQGETGKEEKKPAERPGATKPVPEFDLLGPPPKSQQVDEHALHLRRTMLNWHQGVGLGMFALQLATTVTGQLNYNDKFGGDNSGKYVQPHAILAFSTLGAFAATAALALLAPAPPRRSEGFDRISLHKLAMFTAAAGMAAQGVLGVWTQSRDGYLNQQSVGTAHLVIGYVTLAAVATGIGALVF